jgi:hypothetical protein
MVPLDTSSPGNALLDLPPPLTTTTTMYESDNEGDNVLFLAKKYNFVVLVRYEHMMLCCGRGDE